MSNTKNSSAASASLIHPKYRPDIDGLRAIAVLSVVGFHAFPKEIKGGFIGVDIFFVISGFLISLIIFSNLENDRFSIADFYSRRVKRIFPALLLVLISSYMFGWFALLADEYGQLGKHLAGGAGFISNFILLAEVGYFDNSAETKPLLHLWSLAVEEQFYIFWPLLLAFVWRRDWSFVVITSAVAGASFVFNIFTVDANQTMAFYSPVSRFWELMVGGFLAYITLHKPNLNGRYQNAQSLFGLCLLAFGLFFVNKDRAFPGWWALLPTLGAFFIISAGPQAWFNKYVLSNKMFVWVGLISYPLYLWHWPVLSFSRIVESKAPDRGLAAGLVFASIVLAWLTYRFVEKPFRFGEYGKTKIAALLVLMVSLGLVGYGTYKHEGFGSRKSLENSTFTTKITDQFVGPFWKYTKNNICMERYPFKEAAEYRWWFCMASKDVPPSLILLGSSFANQQYPGFALNGELNHHSILSIGTCDAAGADEVKVSESVNFSPCSGYRSLHQQQFIDKIIEDNKSIRFAILDGLELKPDQKYIDRLKKRVDFLEGNNIKVVIYVPHLKVDYDIRGCYSRPLKRIEGSCELGIDARKALSANFKPLVDQLSKTNPKVAFFDQNDLFCDGLKCSMVRDGMPLFRDEHHHISEYGSVELSKIFVEWARTNMPELLGTQP